jgi:SAM-dependent methyltransferase
LKFIDNIATMKSYPVLDVPCGFGRHSLLLAEKGCQVVSIDINEKMLDYISREGSRRELAGSMTTRRLDLDSDAWDFKKESIGAIINVHYYCDYLLDNFIACLVPGGFLYIETPGGQGGNYAQLPIKNAVRAKLHAFFRIFIYEEKPVGPLDSARVTLKVFAQKIRQRERSDINCA